MKTLSPLPSRARAIAERAHAEQRYGDRPYVVHLEQVVAVLHRFGVATPEREAAGWLHDVLEDTSVSSADLQAAGIPASVIAMVSAVTDEPGANRKERKAKTYPKIAALRDAVIIKLADRIANVEAGGTIGMYAQEYPSFRSALFDPAHDLAPMWGCLDGYLAHAGISSETEIGEPRQGLRI